MGPVAGIQQNRSENSYLQPLPRSLSRDRDCGLFLEHSAWAGFVYRPRSVGCEHGYGTLGISHTQIYSSFVFMLYFAVTCGVFPPTASLQKKQAPHHRQDVMCVATKHHLTATSPLATGLDACHPTTGLASRRLPSKLSIHTVSSLNAFPSRT